MDGNCLPFTYPMRVLVLSLLLCLLIAGCNHDKVADVCLPTSLLTNDYDSIVYQYNDNRQLTTIYSYYGNRHLGEQTDLVYNDGKLVKVTHTFSTDPPYIDHVYNLEYGADGLPSKMTDMPPNSSGQYVTEFTHDSNKRLIKAVTTFSASNFPELAIHGYEYEYNGAGNVTKVTYLILNTRNTLDEVLARENLTFDDRRVFYAESKDLTTLNVYVNSYVPNTNNTLTSRIIYTSYNSWFMSPVDVAFTPVYDDAGRLKNYTTVDFAALPSFGDLTFTRAIYECK